MSLSPKPASGRTLAIDGGDPIRETFLPFGRPSISEEEIEAVAEVLRSGWIGTGHRTAEFESRFADYVGAEHAVSVSSCTAGLHLSLLVAGVGPGDEVITTAMTFAATVEVILQVGATPVLVDIERDSLNLDLQAVEQAITPRTRALLPVHFGGLPCELERAKALCESHDLALVEDAAHAVGAVHNGRRIGGHGNLAAFSFYPNKNITTIEGGMVTTEDASQAEEMKLLRLHGLSSDAWKRYETNELIQAQVLRPGYKYNLTDVQAVLGLGQLARLEGFLETRERIAARYDRELLDLPIARQQRPDSGGRDRHGLHLYVVLLDLEKLSVDRDQVARALRAENIGVGVHYQAIQEHPYFADRVRMPRGGLPVATSVSASTMTLPLSPSMMEDDVWQVIEAVRAVLTHYTRPREL